MPVGRIVTLWTGSAFGSTAAQHGVAGLVVGGRPPSPRSESAIDSRRWPMSTRSRADSKSAAAICVAPAAHGEQGGLVDEVGQVGAAHAGRAPGHDVEVDVGADALVAWQCTSRIGQALVELGQRHDDLAVEAAGAQQGGVEDVGPVGGRHHHDALGGLEAVHLGEHLVERLLPLVVAAAEAGAALAADRVDLVDEDDRPAHLAGRTGTGRAPGWRRRRRTSP